MAGRVGRLSVGEEKAPSFVRSLPEGLKGARDIHLGGGSIWWSVIQNTLQILVLFLSSHFSLSGTNSSSQEKCPEAGQASGLTKAGGRPSLTGQSLMGPSLFWG